MRIAKCRKPPKVGDVVVVGTIRFRVERVAAAGFFGESELYVRGITNPAIFGGLYFRPKE